MRAHIGVTIGNATSVAVCHTGDLADDIVFTSPTVLYMSDDGIARLGDGDGVAAGRFVADMTEREPITLDDGASYLPEDLLAAAAYCLVETVSELHGLTDTPHCTLTCPDAWDEDALTALADALTTAGLPDASLVPDSEALRTWWDRSYYGPAAVVDVGVTGTRVSLVGTDARGDASFAVAYPTGDTFTGALIAHVVAIVSDQGYDVDVHDRATVIGLGAACEAAKIALSTAESTVVPVRLPDVEVDVPVSRAAFEGLISREARTVPDVVDDCLLAHGLTRGDIGSIVLIGGSATLVPLRSAFDHFDVPVVIEEYASARGAALTHEFDDIDFGGDDDPTEAFPVVTPPIETPVAAATPIAKRRRPSRRLTITAAVAMTFLAVGAASAAVSYSSRTVERNPTDQVFLPPVEITSTSAAPSSTTPPETTPSTTEPEPTLDPTTYVAPTRVRFTPAPTVVVPPPPPVTTTTVAVPTTTEPTTTEPTTTTTAPTTTTTTTTTATTTTTTKPAEAAG